MGAILAVLNKKGEDAAETALTMMKALENKYSEGFGLASSTVFKKAKTLSQLRNQNWHSPVMVGHAFSKTLPWDMPQPIRMKGAALVFEGRIYPSVAGESDAEALSNRLRPTSAKSAATLVKESSGDFALAAARLGRLIAARDSMGVCPLYFGETPDCVALASERKALWMIGIMKVESFPPGTVAFIDKKGCRLESIKTLRCSRTKTLVMSDAAAKLRNILGQSVRERVSALKEVAVAFSGGLDSSIVAFLAKNSGVDVHLISVSLGNQAELAQAEAAAAELRLPVHIRIYDQHDVEVVLPEVLRVIEDSDPVSAAIGVPMYWAAQNAARLNLRIMLAGHGADELFGGYRRYEDCYSKHSAEKTRKMILDDILHMYERNFERDYKTCNCNGVELRLPFSAYRLAKFAVEMPLELKICSGDGGLRKLVLRHVAKSLGLSRLITEKPKKAVQYSTGVDKAIRRLAAQKELTTKEYVQRIFRLTCEKMMRHA